MERELSDMVTLILFIPSAPLTNGFLNLGSPMIEALHGTPELIWAEGSFIKGLFLRQYRLVLVHSHQR